MERNKIGFVTGLAAEARLLRGSGFPVGVGGGFPEGAEAAAEGLVTRGVAALVSFGVAGGLAPELEAGALLVPGLVLDGGRDYRCDDGLMAFLGGPSAGAVAASHRILGSVAEKRELFRQSGGAAAVDMESGAVARVAARHGLAFAVLRAVADRADRELPAAALAPLRADGGIDFLAVLRAVAARPGQIGGLLGLARDAGRARAALKRRVEGLGRETGDLS